MNRTVALVAAVFVVAVLPGCFLPCEICAACVRVGTGSVSVSPTEASPLPEVGPQLQTTALTTAVAR